MGDTFLDFESTADTLAVGLKSDWVFGNVSDLIIGVTPKPVVVNRQKHTLT